MLGLTSLDLGCLVSEFQAIVGNRLNKVYQDKHRFSFKFGHQSLNIVLPGLAFLSSELRFSTPTPSSFTMSLRKRITNSKLVKVSRSGFDRILVLELHKEFRFRLIVELFSKGNIILVDDSNKILSLYSTQSWRSRELKRGLMYELPPSKGYENLDFSKAMADSKQDSVVKALAIEFGLGGLYSEEICKLAAIDKHQPPPEVDAKTLKRAMDKFLKKEPSPQLYLKQATPFALTCHELSTLQELPHKPFKTMSSLIEHYIGLELPKAEDPQVKRLSSIVADQAASIEKLSASIEENTKKGEAIYENYQQILALLEGFKAIAAKQGWNKGFAWLSKQPNVKSLNKQKLSFVFEK